MLIYKNIYIHFYLYISINKYQTNRIIHNYRLKNIFLNLINYTNKNILKITKKIDQFRTETEMEMR